MKSNNSDLLARITQKAPWLLEDDKTFFPENIPGDVRQIIRGIKDFNLTIITEEGRVFKQHLILQILADELLIDTPFEWYASASSFHVFFRNESNVLNYFHVTDARSDQEKITAGIPDSICVLQKRRFTRSLTPHGTKVLFWNDNRMIDSAFVHDISEGGMLLCSGGPEERYPVNSIIHEVFILLPTEAHNNETKVLHRVLPFITKAKIVRTHKDRSSSILHYGVSFIHENVLVYKRFNALIAKLKDQISNQNLSDKELNFVPRPYRHLSVAG